MDAFFISPRLSPWGEILGFLVSSNHCIGKSSIEARQGSPVRGKRAKGRPCTLRLPLLLLLEVPHEDCSDGFDILISFKTTEVV